MRCSTTNLERGNNVSLDSITVGLGNIVHSKVSDERVEGHGATNDGGIIPHCTSCQYLGSSNSPSILTS